MKCEHADQTECIGFMLCLDCGATRNWNCNSGKFGDWELPPKVAELEREVSAWESAYNALYEDYTDLEAELERTKEGWKSATKCGAKP